MSMLERVGRVCEALIPVLVIIALFSFYYALAQL